jgi:Collagen triple helix repeat (20 copies)
MRDIELMADGVIAACKGYVDQVAAGFKKRVDELSASLEQRFAALPVLKDGAPGSSAFQIACLGGFTGSEGEWLESLRGKDGATGDPGIAGAAGERGENGADAEPGRAGEPGKDGAPGKDGERGTDGAPGKDGTPGRDGTPGKDAEPVHPDTLALMVVTEVQKAVDKAVAVIPKAVNGEPGRDAIQCEPLLSIDEAKSYPRGTYASHRGGMIRSFRQTDAIGAAGLMAAGWAVMQNGIESETEISDQDGRQDWRCTKYTDGTELVRTIARAVVIDRGVYREGEKYAKGDGVTWGGSFWIAQKDTDSKPDSADGSWRLAVKRGRDGADAKAK